MGKSSSCVTISPPIIREAYTRAGIPLENLFKKFPKLDRWESGDEKPTLKQLEDFAHSVHIPLGYLFLDQLPAEELPFSDFRTLKGAHLFRPSRNLLDTIYLCEERQDWYKDFALKMGYEPLSFVNSASIKDSPEKTAKFIISEIDFHLEKRVEHTSIEQVLRMFVECADLAGVLVMISSVVGNSTARKLDIEEFRGFALADPYAPLVFINGTDSTTGKMFTLAHELAHICLGSSALSDAGIAPPVGYRKEEVWCNAVAAEILVPMDDLQQELIKEEPLDEALTRLKRKYKVSKMVLLRRLLDANWVTRLEFDGAWKAEQDQWQKSQIARTGGGDFYKTLFIRTGKRFANALVESTLEGSTLYRDAFHMFDIKKSDTFKNIVESAGLS